MNSNLWKVIGRGFAGWHASDGTGRSSSGGRLMPYVYRHGVQSRGYLEEAEEGCFVYDAQHLESDNDAAVKFVRWVYQSPMVSAKLAPGEIESAGPLGFIAPDVWIKNLLDSVPGVRYGYVKNGRIDWIVGGGDE